jgi:hypothetical protein
MSSHFHPGLDDCTPIHPRSFATGNNSFVHGYEGTPFQQDNVRPQTARISTRMQRLEEAGVDVLLGPSPFARSMAHIWEMIGRRISNLAHRPQTLGDINKNKQMLSSICYLALAFALK